MLTELHNKHFSERLYYADSLPSGVDACHNGNIAAAYIANRDTACTFSYTYDAQNHLLSSVRLTENGTSNSELFTYDEVGNVLSLQRFSNNRKIDDLQYDYGNDGNQLLTVTDNGQDADDYSTIEYHNTETQADTTMRYDANGNLVYDADRGISLIKYNILNLPDTIQFVNGNQIVNLYDAAGRKYKSITYTVPVTAVTPRYEIMHYTFDTDTVEFLAAEYAGNIENHYSRTDTIQRIHNSIGYYTNSTYYHYIKDHLGNICAVVNSTRDSVIQSTLYYASGVPMAQSFGRDKQPYLYNGKEFVEAHGWNTYDYGFRGYYAPTGRFTTIDPLAESTPWQSPYAYANNNFINAVDWMGLGGLYSGYTSMYGWMAQDNEGNVVGWGNDDNDWHVYEVDEEWDGTYGGLKGHSIIIGWEIIGKDGRKPHYVKGAPTYYLGSITQVSLVSGHWMVVGSTALIFGNKTVTQEIDNSTSAFLHYFFGFGSDIALGNDFTRRSMLANSDFINNRKKILNGELDKIGFFAINMTSQVFHIGKTSVYYRSNDAYTIFCMGVNDGYWDVLYLLEKSSRNPNGITPDGDGWKLEVSIPYHYIPIAVMLPNN